ncbi:U4/U6 small nuclear ribonucleoprotein [Dunaliella salina]|uniref:U4/U6 small nuclear ribonucleoprotein n=1 Tax=Dunaliella salina TaxID=3046 RepID=A0ABQ7GFW7_DUNSA|nr:U4/U6 small nuclear ribonucleoprotein [Dunaliella salina]|eukprot:KAF5833497.1 U4/U6 small nuclear ribonucleoprotein [Dunaliella salina]
MAQTLADTFLADLDQLSDDEPNHEEEQHQEQEKQPTDELDDIEALNYDDLGAVAKLSRSGVYKDIMEKVTAAAEGKEVKMEDQNGSTEATVTLEDDPTYKLLVQCNRLAVDIDNEITIVHNFIRDKYRLKFPELESLVHHPIDYARVVKRIGNEMDLTLVNLDDMLPAATVMVVTVTGTTTSGKPLSQENLDKALEACEMAFKLDEDKHKILQFVESRMASIAPNLSLIVGSEIAAKLMGLAGGLHALSRMPACNVLVLGAKRKNLAGFSSATAQPHQGLVYACAVVTQTPPSLRIKAARLVAAKCTLLARVDAYGQDPTGAAGQKMREEIIAKIEKWQEPPPAKTVKPLPKPDEHEGRKRRGGRRLRKMKERYGLTDMRVAQNRMNFNQQEEEYMDGDEVVGLGVLGKEGSGRLRMVANQSKLKISAKNAKKARQAGYGGATSGLQSSGMQTSLAFTPVQGFELADPTKLPGNNPASLQERSGTESYFSNVSGFRSIKKLG